MRESSSRNLSAQKGFTLVELMIATLLLTVALLGVASLAVVVINGNNLSKRITTSTLLSNQKLEYYQGIGYSNFSTGTVIENYGTITSVDGNTSLYSGYKRVSVVENGPIPDTRKLTVTIYRQHDNVSSNFYTLIAK